MADTAPEVIEDIVEVIERFPDGATIEQLETVLRIPRRTLQRRLAQLVASGRIHATGSTRKRRYQIHSITADPDPGPEELTLSPGAQKIRELIRRPLTQRKPVGYVSSFLETYRPNRDFYLDAKLRARLRERGRALGHAQPAGTYARQILSRLLIDLSWASSRLEGNTYTRLDTQNLIELDLQPPRAARRQLARRSVGGRPDPAHRGRHLGHRLPADRDPAAHRGAVR